VSGWKIGNNLKKSRLEMLKMRIKAIPVQPHERLGRYCDTCGERYVPTGKFQKICSECSKQSNGRRRKVKLFYCKFCGVECSGKFRIELRKGTYHPFCTHCFSLLQNKPVKEIKESIKSDTFK